MSSRNSIIQQTRQRVADLYSRLGVTPPQVDASDIPEICVIIGSSRSGSSMLFHLLAESGAFVTPQGEETPLYRQEGLGWVDFKSQSDEVKPPLAEDTRAAVFANVVADLGVCGSDAPSLQSPEFLAQAGARLLRQWPGLDLDTDVLIEALVSGARRAVNAEGAWRAWLDTLGLDVGLYDLPGPKSRNLQLEIPSLLMEEPPFVIQTPRALASTDVLKQKPVLLKTSTHAYRVSLLKTLFPRSRFRWILLGRNPASSINGLMDGWLSNAFHSHCLEFVQPLRIRGYSDTVPLGSRWWKFDLPPGWSEYDDAPLADVCAFQWRSAYDRILNLPESGDTYLSVKYEDLLDPGKSAGVLEQIFEFSKAKPLEFPEIIKTRPVMASTAPGPARWLKREDEIRPLLQTNPIRTLAERLGYDLSSPADLI